MQKSNSLKWWSGNISNAELSECTGIAPANLKYALKLPGIKETVEDGGRGSRGRRRVSARGRAALSLVSAVQLSNLQITVAANIAEHYPEILDSLVEVVDFVEPLQGVNEIDGITIPTSAYEWEEFGSYTGENHPLDWYLFNKHKPYSSHSGGFDGPWNAIDEFLEVIDNQWVFWIRPRIAPVQTIRQLVSFINSDKYNVDTYSKLYDNIKYGKVEQVPKRLGVIERGVFSTRDSDLFSRVSRAPAKFIGTPDDVFTVGQDNGTRYKFISKLSINLSIPLRKMKRNFLIGQLSATA
jgi:hypothetical protein